MKVRALMTPATAEGPKRLLLLIDLDPAFYSLGAEERERVIEAALMEAKARVEAHVMEQREPVAA